MEPQGGCGLEGSVGLDLGALGGGAQRGRLPQTCPARRRTEPASGIPRAHWRHAAAACAKAAQPRSPVESTLVAHGAPGCGSLAVGSERTSRYSGLYSRGAGL